MDKSEAKKFAAILSAAGSNPETVPAGWYSRMDIAKAWGYSDPHTARKLRLLVEDGKADFRKFRIRVGSGTRCYPVPHYRLK